MLEPYVLKGTRTVPRRGEMSNHLFLFDKDSINPLSKKQNLGILTFYKVRLFNDQDGYKILNIIFNNTLSHVSEKSKGDGIFYGVNNKYTIPGGG